MQAMMLTVQKENAGALRMYEGLGYGIDSSSPHDSLEMPVGYCILSKKLDARPALTMQNS